MVKCSWHCCPRIVSVEDSVVLVLSSINDNVVLVHVLSVLITVFWYYLSMMLFQALSENPGLVFVKPQWIHSCHDKSKLMPHQKHIVVP